MFEDLSKVTVFVSIAAYRDSEVPKTVADLFEKADHPERIFVGVLNQIDTTHDREFIIKGHPRIRQRVVSHLESQGACWARHTVFKDLMGQEDFVLQIDSHMRFDQGWDTSMLSQWTAANDCKAVLTNYPMPYDTDTGHCHPQMFVQHCCKQFDQIGLPMITSFSISLNDAPIAPKPTVFLAAGCFFGRSEVVRDVPYDPHLYFNGEEISYAVRLWTHGYNLYLPNHPFLYHDYGVDRGRRIHSSDNPKGLDRHGKALNRVRTLLQVNPSPTVEDLHELDLYGLGSKRSLTQWQFYSGLHFKQKLICKNVIEGEFGLYKDH